MRKLVIGFSRPKGLAKPFSWLIRLIEKTPYSHVYVRARSENLNTDLIYQASGLQVNFTGLQLFKDWEISLFEFEAEIEDETYKNFMRWAIINSGADYSLKQALGIAVVKLFNLKKNPLSTGQRSWVCSELAGYVLNSFIGIHIEQDVLDSAGPKDIFHLCTKFLKPIEVTNG